MEGVALLAAYLREKKGVDNLFVCKSLEAFQEKLNEVSRLEGNTRLALVMTLWPEEVAKDDKKDGEYGTRGRLQNRNHMKIEARRTNARNE